MRSENNWLKDPATSRRRSRDTAERFVAYSKSVLELIKKDIESGIKIDPTVVKNLEDTIARHEPGGGKATDVAGPLDRIRRFQGGGQR